MSKVDIDQAARTIMSLTRSCPKVKFFLTESIVKRLMEMAPKGLFDELKFRICYVPRGFFSVLADIVHEDDTFSALRRDDKRKTTVLLHDILLLKKRNPEYARELLKLLKAVEMHPLLLEKYKLSRMAAKVLCENHREFEETRKDAIALLECFIKNYG